MSAEKLKIFIGGEYRQSETNDYVEVFNPSTGEVDGLSPCSTKKEVEESIEVAHKAFKSWSRVPVIKRVQVLHKVRQLLIERMDELTMICAREHGKVWEEAKGDVEQDNSISISGLPNQIDNKQSKIHEDSEDGRSQGFRPKWRH